MGGSGAIGDVISAILSREDIHVSNVKGYLLPKTVDERTLVISTSISGNTKETLSILDYKEKSKAKFVAISSGGIMKEKCLKKSIYFHKSLDLVEIFLEQLILLEWKDLPYIEK